MIERTGSIAAQLGERREVGSGLIVLIIFEPSQGAAHVGAVA
jgi:hypothetical protein